MRPETPFDIDEIFHAADAPDMAVDTDAVITTGRRVRRRRRLAGAAGLTAATIVAAVALTTATGVVGSDRTVDQAPASSATPPPTTGPAGPAPGESIALRDVHLPAGTGSAMRAFSLEYGLVTPGRPVLGVESDDGPVQVLRVTPDSGPDRAGPTTVAFEPPDRAEGTTMHDVGLHGRVAIAPAGAEVSLDTSPDADLGGVSSDAVDIPGTASQVWVFSSEETMDESDVRGLLVDHDGRLVHVTDEGSSQEVPDVMPGVDGDPARVYYSEELDLLGLVSGTGTGYSKHPSQSGDAVTGGLAHTGAPGAVGDSWVFAVLPEGTGSAQVRDADGRTIPLRLTPLEPGTVVAYAHEVGTRSPRGELTITWVDADGEESSSPLR